MNIIEVVLTARAARQIKNIGFRLFILILKRLFIVTYFFFVILVYEYW